MYNLRERSNFHKVHPVTKASRANEGELGYFLGGVVTGVTFHHKSHDIDLTLDGMAPPMKGAPCLYHMFSEHIVEIKTAGGEPNHKLFDSMLYHKFGHRDVGWGHVCQWCGTTYVTGVLTCVNCGGGTVLRGSAVERAVFSATLAEYNCHLSVPVGDLHEVRSSFTLAIDQGTGMKVVSGPGGVDWVRTLGQFGHVSQPRAYLCPWCGSLCDWDKHNCTFCGGHRLAEQVLQDLRRTCWVCGVETVGNYVCDGCQVELGNRK